MGVPSSLSSASTPGSSFASPRRRLLSLTVTLLLALGLAAPLPAAAAGTAPTVVVTTSGMDRLVAGVASRITVNVRVTDQASLRGDTPLRLLGELTDTDGAALDPASVAQVTGGDVTPLSYDGRFVAPHEDSAAFSLDNMPALLTPSGATFAFDVTVPDTNDVRFVVDLVASNERSASVLRREGPDRAGTAAAVSRANFNPGVPVVFISRSNDFADALAVGPAAGLGGNPILLTGHTELPEATRAELTRLAPGRIVVLGGSVAIDDAVVTALDPFTDGTVTRLAGDDRYATAAAIATTLFTAPVDVVYIATGTNFADALAGGPAAAMHDAPLLLVRRDGIPTATADALRALSPQRIVVLGGPAAVDDETVGALAAFAPSGVTRVFGATRYETAARIAAGFPAPTSVVYLATGRDFPDAMTGAAAAILDGAPILLIDGDAIPQVVLDQLARLTPAVVIILGGPNAVPASVSDAVATSTRTVEPDRDRFTPLSNSAPSTVTPGDAIGFISPNADEPLTVRPGDRFVARVVAPRAGDFAVEYRPAGGDWTSFLNLTAVGTTTGGGAIDVPLNAPLTDGVYDLRITSTSDAATESAVLVEGLTVALTFPPPLISSLVENVDGQSQLIAVRPIGGLAEVGTVLDIDLSSAERRSADYPVDATVTILGGNGTAELIVSRDNAAMVRYVAGEGDPLDPDDATSNPLLTFRIDGIDVGSGDDAHVGRFYRWDIEHGVQRVFLTGAGSSIASPTVSNLQSGNPHGPQFVSFALRTPLAAGQTVTIDLSEAERNGVNYEESFAFVDGGGHGASPAVEHGPPPVGNVAITAVPDESAILTFTAGPDGVPSVQPEGPTINIFIGAVSVDDVRAATDVTFSRSDGGVASAAFSIQPMGITNLEASDLERATADQAQTFAVTLDGRLEAGTQLSFDLSGAANSSVDYSNAAVTVTGGTGDATIETFVEWGTTTYLTYTSAGDPDTEPIVLTVTGATTADADRSEMVTVYRTDSWGSATTYFDVGAGSLLAGTWVSDLPTESVDQWQGVSFLNVEGLDAGTEVTIDLTSAEVGGVSYGATAATNYGEFGGSVVLDVVADTSAVLTYTVGDDGLPAGSWVYVELSHVASDAVETTYPVTFAVDDQEGGSTSFRTVRFPGLADVTVTDLASGTYGQTQTVSFRLVGDLSQGQTVNLDLSGAERGGARYGGADAMVTSTSGSADLWVYSGDYANISYTAGADTPSNADGEVITLEIRGVNTDAVDETHRADFYRDGGYGGSYALFNIGEGGAFVGPPYVDDIYGGSTSDWQWVTFALTRAMSPGDTVTVDFSAAEVSGVSYLSAAAETYGDAGTWEFSVVAGESAVATFTAGAMGVPATHTVDMSISGIDASSAAFYTTFDVIFRDVATDGTATDSFVVYPDYYCC